MSSPHDKLVPEPSEEARDGGDGASTGRDEAAVLAFPPLCHPPLRHKGGMKRDPLGQ